MADIKVLYVEDSRSSSPKLRRALKDEGLSIVFCGGGFDALDELASDGADIVVAATKVSDLSGYQLASLIKSSELVSQLPVVLFYSGETATDDFWIKAARPDVVVGEEDLKEPAKVACMIRDLAENARLAGWEKSIGRGVLVPSQGFSSNNLVESYSSLLNDLILERAVNRTARTLTALVEPRSQFLEAFFTFIGEIFQPDLMGIIIADVNSPWAAVQVKGNVSQDAYDPMMAGLLKQLKLPADLKVELRGELLQDNVTAARSLASVEVLTVASEKQGHGALVFASAEKNAFSAGARAFMGVLKQELKPVIQLLLAKQEIEELHSREAYRAAIDSLTGLYNLEFLVGFLQQQLLFSFRQRLPVGMAIIDVDNFAKVNEEHGYEIGDSVLNTVANKLLQITRSSDLLARYGGDQFAVVLPNTDLAGTRVLGEKVRSEMEFVNFGQENGRKGPKVTVSVGCANFNMEDLNPETILRDAKIALRQAKEAGRNQVCS